MNQHYFIVYVNDWNTPVGTPHSKTFGIPFSIAETQQVNRMIVDGNCVQGNDCVGPYVPQNPPYIFIAHLEGNDTRNALLTVLDTIASGKDFQNVGIVNRQTRMNILTDYIGELLRGASDMKEPVSFAGIPLKDVKIFDHYDNGYPLLFTAEELERLRGGGNKTRVTREIWRQGTGGAYDQVVKVTFLLCPPGISCN
jgi:hypothetical protein